ncbi:hypothetical protein GCK32_016516 [Trichostrongylus colubriformis]|uniref:Uncharacterized protein n=1 Tax=Trichostrongylus colubriformis TaxID=6319 RepID=A0AAN8INP9_TRICO
MWVKLHTSFNHLYFIVLCFSKAPKRVKFVSQYPKKGKSQMTVNAPERRTRQATKYKEKNEAKAEVPKAPKAKGKRPGTKYVKKVRTATKAKITKKKGHSAYLYDVSECRFLATKK